MFGEKLKHLRKQKNMKQSELAVVLGVHRSQIATYETNRGKPSFEVLIKLADHFKVPLDYFYDSADQTELFVQVLDLSEEELKKRVEFFFAGEKLTDEEIRKMIDYVRFLRFNKDNK